MARQARQKSENGVYHVLLCGSNRQLISLDAEDSDKFLSLLRRVKEECGFELYGYCMMGNHVHLLLREHEVPLSTVFRKLGTAYVYYFNLKYSRVGPLFQGRFRSVPVPGGELVQTLRFIHRNPVKANICDRPEDYIRSSYREYLSGQPGITDTEVVMKIFTPAALREYTEEENDDAFLDVVETPVRRLTDREARERMRKLFGAVTPEDIRTMDRGLRNRILAQLKANGLSITQIHELTGASRTMISRSHDA